MTLQAQDIVIPAQTTIAARTAVGHGTGVLTTASDGVITLEANSEKFDSYAENTKQQAAVLDYVFPQPIALPAGSNRIGFQYQNLGFDTNSMLRVLVEDRRGGMWAVGTRLGAGCSRLNSTNGYARLVTFPFDTNELGRIDPWVMMSLDPKKFDEYDLPQSPFKLAGFRLVLEGTEGKVSTLKVTNLRALFLGEKADPYWTLVPEKSWQGRLGKSAARQRSGWGPETPAPTLSAGDLNLSQGNYTFTWEVLGVGQWQVLAAQSEKVCISPDLGKPAIEFPLMPTGTYHLRIATRKEGEKTSREYFLTYVVIRNSKMPAAFKASNGKPLHFESKGDGIFDLRQQQTTVKITCAPNDLGDAGGKIRWTIESADKRPLKTGEDEARTGAVLDLRDLAKQEKAFWITARLIVAGEERDIARRVVGFQSGPLQPLSEKTAAPNSKLDVLAGQFYRTKGDWNEGGSRVASESSQLLKDYGPWIDEANQIGYNMVELPATWWEMNPLPGVYQFEYLDRLVALAKERHIRVVLRVHPAPGNVPLWVSREFQTDQNGSVDGLFGGNNLIHTPSSVVMRESLNTYLEVLARHYQSDPYVVGYTLSSVYFDHDLLDMPWLGQTIDYSEASRTGFVDYLRDRYHGDLSAVAAAHGKPYVNWDKITIPVPNPMFDSAGRLMPRTDALWQDWFTFKIDITRQFRISGAQALRRGDPGCWVGLYSSDITPYATDEMVADQFSLACGSMEFQLQFPAARQTVPVRFESIWKVTKTATLVDVGLSNMLISAPADYYSSFNYWMDKWRLATVEPSIREAEERLRQWYSVVDQLVGTKFADTEDADKRHGVYMVSYEVLKQILQQMGTGRMDDCLKPFLFRVGADKVVTDQLLVKPGKTIDLTGYPYVYVPYSTALLDQSSRTALVDYVKGGGKLVMEAMSGFWAEDGKTSNRLADSLGLPEARPVSQKPSAASESAVWGAESGFEKASLAFRIQPFEPPINDQATPWIHNIPRAFLRACRFDAGQTGGAEVLARFADRSPAVLLLKLGKGEVLYFCGTVDWISCPGLSSAIDQWAGHSGKFQFSGTEGKYPDLLARTLRKGDRVFVVGRRFISQDEIAGLEVDKTRDNLKQTKDIEVPLGVDSSKSYHVRDLLNGVDLGIIRKGTMPKNGVTLKLMPGQAFIVAAKPVD